ncbi:hypothetical protein [Nonomuraea jabiensis]|uniref:Uncharacterized protein n=1 Tax=Nonomuraea jabiensis TaxID=882448 RepID=A0A7W9GEH5_9ACTN|nr:hypothetical protein [Nonomuraea jabiensis]MBB5782236.1 hypothetical protein [Nonomuraea jabiensis]
MRFAGMLCERQVFGFEAGDLGVEEAVVLAGGLEPVAAATC